MNKVLKYTLAAAVAMTMTVSSYALITVTWGAGGSTGFDDMTGTPLANGDVIEVGYFSSTAGFSSLNTAALNLANFTTYASGLVGDGGYGDGSGFGQDANDVTGWTHTHAQIYVVAFNAPTIAGATQMGVWSVDLASMSTWRFPTDTDIPNNTFTDLDDLTAVPGTVDGALATGANIWMGTGSTADANAGMALEQIVPEPSTYALILMGLFGTIAMIRRRR